ncbi:MAG TPA: hypothetical protein VH760_00995 [Gaiellaceae bacterium]|jgi:hypothetical protein
MAEESETRKFFDRLKDATANVAQMTKEGVESVQLKRELGQAYGDLGRKTEALVESGAITHAELTEPVARIAELKERLAALAEPDDEAAAPAPDEAPPPPDAPAPPEPEG